MASELRPDVLTMDIHMPILNGLDATEQIMSTCPTPIVIISSTTRIHDVEWAMKALQAGALTLLMKPIGPNVPNFATTAKELIETVKAMAAVKVVGRRNRLDAQNKSVKTTPPTASRAVRAVAIAASTGGPPALLQVLSCLPVDFPAPILIVQHIADGFTDGFVSWLDVSLPLSVKQAEQTERLQPGVVYVAPENRHLGVKGNGDALLSSEQPIGGFCPSATFLFESVGRVFGRSSIAVILTGMGNDGVAGLDTLRSRGGYVIAQDEDSCVVYGMPGAANQAGVVDVTLPLDQIGAAVLRQQTFVPIAEAANSNINHCW